jgi:crotonobetainyl-CoA:carnitine CoA-transferase CaiB-like acyl-CoA transferase
MTGSKPKHVLDGYKVLDFTQFVAGPTVTRLMAEMGAEVIKVEFAPGGDRTRTVAFIKNGRSGYFVQQNRGKLSLCVDVRKPAGKALLSDLVPKVDVLVENFAPGAISRLGFGYDVVSKLHPEIIMCSISTFGQSGPLAGDPGYDWIGQAYAGVTALSGQEGAYPQPPVLAMGDVSTGVHALAAVACALLYRDRTGRGQHLDISLLDSYFHYHDLALQMYSASGGATRLERSGAHYPQLCPAGIFKGKTGYIAIFAWLDHQWAKLCETMGRLDLIGEPRFVDNPTRLKHRDEIILVIEAWLASMPSDEASVEAMRAAHIPVAPVLSPEQAKEHPHMRQRRTVRKVRDRVMGEIEIPGFPLRFSEFPGELDLEAPLLGEHNERILTGYLGYTPERLSQLTAEGVLQSAPN